jgi:hypothetical protein
MEDKTMMDIVLLLEVLKFFLLGYGLYKAYRQRQKEKALSAELENITQRLSILENVNKSKKLDE